MYGKTHDDDENMQRLGITKRAQSGLTGNISRIHTRFHTTHILIRFYLRHQRSPKAVPFASFLASVEQKAPQKLPQT